MTFDEHARGPQPLIPVDGWLVVENPDDGRRWRCSFLPERWNLIASPPTPTPYLGLPRLDHFLEQASGKRAQPRLHLNLEEAMAYGDGNLVSEAPDALMVLTQAVSGMTIPNEAAGFVAEIVLQAIRVLQDAIRASESGG